MLYFDVSKVTRMAGWIEINEMKHEFSFFIALKYSSVNDTN